MFKARQGTMKTHKTTISIKSKKPSPSHCARARGLWTSPCTWGQITLTTVVTMKMTRCDGDNDGANSDDNDGENDDANDGEYHLRFGDTKSTAEPPAESANTYVES